jgi:predicted Zn finger-like uncharacterized protein
MKARCPNCSTSYRVADEKVPGAGAQIKCPKCNTFFVVKRSPVAPAPSTQVPKAQHQQSTPLDALSGKSPASPAPVPAPQETPAAAKKVEPDRQARGVSAIRAQSGMRTQAPMAPTMNAYRVRTQKGLTYDFSTRETMIRWLREKNDLTGCEASAPGEKWQEAHVFIEAVPLGDAAAAKMALAPGAIRSVHPENLGQAGSAVRPVSPEAGVFIWVTVGLSALLVILVAATTLTRYGVVDLSSYLPLESVGIRAPGQTAERNASEAPEVTDAENPEKVFRKAINLARRSIRAKRFSKAALEYNRALCARPNSEEALDGLVKAYNGLGDRGRAEAVMERVQAIKGE